MALKFAALAFFAILGGCAIAQPTDEPASREGPPSTLAARPPFTEPPGALCANVHQSSIATTICMSRWTTTARPPTSYAQPIKRRMLVRIGVAPAETGQYDLDYFIPLARGGSPTSLDNFSLQRWLGPWNARTKDRLERKLQVFVCSGKLSLQAVRNAIRAGWKDAYAKYVQAGQAPRGMESDDNGGPVEWRRVAHRRGETALPFAATAASLTRYAALSSQMKRPSRAQPTSATGVQHRGTVQTILSEMRRRWHSPGRTLFRVAAANPN
jgi:hypothetical protein